MTIAELVEAARVAVFNALETAHTDASSAAVVLDHVPQDTRPNFVQLADLDWSNEGSKAEPALALTVDVVTIYAGGDRAQLIRLMAINDGALDEVRLSAAGVAFGTARLVAGAATGAASDGRTYAGQQTYEIFAEAE